MLFRAIPILVDAFRLGYNEYPDWFSDMIKNDDAYVKSTIGFVSYKTAYIRQDSYSLKAEHGDWVVKEENGSLHVLSNDEFVRLYEANE